MDEQPKVEQVGLPDWPRYRIVLGTSVWTGEGWDSDHDNALLFACMRAVVPEWREVMSRHFGHRREFKLSTTVTVTVRVDPQFRLDELIRYLAENACVQLDQAPILADAAILNFHVDWPRLKPEVNENENDIFE